MNESVHDSKKKTITRRQLALKSFAIATGLTLYTKVRAKSKEEAVNNSISFWNNNRSTGEVKTFMDDNFLLQSRTAEILYHEYAKDLPIIDYHSHLPPDEIAENKQFNNLTQIWLSGDHYKMRVMRANGVNEKFITGNTSDLEKFIKWGETVPYTLRNPLFYWTHLELKRYFGIEKILNASTAREIFDATATLLKTEEFKVQNLIKSKNVEVICTTDDPADDLLYHQKIIAQDLSVKVIPTWRPDKVMACENPEEYNRYVDRLSKASEINITKYQDLLEALNRRQEFFKIVGCKISDHGLGTFYAEPYTENEVNRIFNKVRSGKSLNATELLKFKSALLLHLAEMNYQFGWVQQFHLGAIRNNNTRMFKLVGPDKGFDSISDFEIAKPMSKFLDQLEIKGKLTKTIVYNLNPRDNDMIVTMLGNFNDGIIPGKMQYGSAWWFLDQKDGIEKQINALSNHGLLGRFIGMLTDSRSFLSFPRHEYFRRLVCNIIATDVENGELPADISWLGKMVEGICYFNAKEYFKF